MILSMAKKRYRSPDLGVVDNPELDPPLTLCVAVLIQAVQDYQTATGRPDWRPAAGVYPPPGESSFDRSPAEELQVFFASSWFTLICEGLGVDPVTVRDRLTG